MFAALVRRRLAGMAVLACLLLAAASSAWAAQTPAQVYVVLWFDTEDYLLPASDDAALHLADFLTREGVRATFKVVGEKARTLERRHRTDVIAALKKHEIGYHANYHSVQPTPALYLSDLGWDDGVAEFDRRERPGFDDVKRIFGTPPTCYGQPGSSWGPQSYAVMRRWGMKVYLDSGSHVGLDDRPCYYCGILTLYELAYVLRANLNEPKQLTEAEGKFQRARQKLLAEGGGIVSIFYHPCEFVHKEFWDGVNFRHGANPPRQRWKEPPAKTPAETKVAYHVFEDYIHFIKQCPRAKFITASQAAKLYRDKAIGRRFTSNELKAIAVALKDQITFQRHENYAISSGEILALLNEYVVERTAGENPAAIELRRTYDGPSNPVPTLKAPVTTDWSQFTRTAADVGDFLRKEGRVPTAVWLGSVGVPPEAYLRSLAEVAIGLVEGDPAPETVQVRPAKFAAADYVAKDDPHLWGWVIFPAGFRAPAMMKLARRQAWTLKPAILDRTAN